MWSYNDRGGETCQKPTLAMHGKARVKAQVGRWGTLSKKQQQETHHVVARVEARVKAWVKDQIEAQFESRVKTRGMA